jgi:serine beta-lactamase-like protein LACTB, mitochondrial
VPNRWNRSETWIGLIVAAAGTLAAVIVGLFTYVTFTATPLHPDPSDVPSVAGIDASHKWTQAVERGRQIMRAGLAERNLPGLSVAVGADGEIVWAEGFGWADLESHERVTPGTRFRIGTASMPLTSSAAGLLLEQGRLELDAEIQRYVPEFPEKPWRVTLRQVMGHLAGVRTDSGDEGPLFTPHCERPVEALRFFADRSLLFEPGTQYRYSSYGWIVVSAAIEQAAGERFFTFMQKQVFEPLGMDDTLPDSATAAIPERATPYFPRFGADPRYGLHLMRPIDSSCYAGAGAFLSTPSDLARFGLAMNASTLLRPATIATLQTSQRIASGEDTGYGLGWDLETATLAGEQTPVAGHDGDLLGGMVASLMTFRDRGLVVAVAANISYADTASLALSVAEAFAEHDGSPAHP